MPTKKDSKTLNDLAARIEADAEAKADELLVRAGESLSSYCERNSITRRSLCKALLDDLEGLRAEVKTNIINEIVKQAKEAKKTC